MIRDYKRLTGLKHDDEMMAVRDLFVENYTDFPFCDEVVLQRQEKRLSKT